MPPGAASEAGEAGERSYGPEAGPAAGTAAAELLPLPPGWASCDLESGPPSPSRIPAFRAPDQQQQEQQSHLPSFQLHAWPATMHSEPAFVDGADSYSAASEQEAQQVRPACRRACHALAGLAAAAAGAVGRLVPAASRLASPPLELPIRSRSMEILSMGREPSAPYLPGKQALRRSSAASAMAARRRWRLACRAVIDARRVEECMDLLADRLAPAEDRLHAAVVLAQRLKAYPQRQQGAQPLGCALLARRPRGQLGWGQVLLQELYVTGECLFAFFTPPRTGRHRPYVCGALVAVLALLYFFMAGQYGQYQAMADPATLACVAAQHANGTAPAWGPASLVRWLSPRASKWCYGGSGAGRFDATFLIDWGARWAPAMSGSPQRWLTSTLLHQSFMHMLSNSLMLLGFGGQLEVKHGNWRTAALALLSALGGGFLSAATEAPCVAVVGASGIVFGLAAACIADMVLNFETLARPLLRTAVLLAFLIFFAVTVGTTAAGTSHMSHVGGFLAGLAGGLVLLPNPQRGRCEAAATAAGAAGLLALLTAAPLVFYLKLLPRVCCGC